MIGTILFTGLLFVMSEILTSQGEYIPPEDMKARLIKIHDICVKKLGLPDDISKNYDFSTKSPEIMCYMKCLMEEGKWAGDDEVPLYDFIIDDLHPEVKPIIEKMINKCKDFPRSTQECETTYNFFACMHDADPEHFYMP